MDEAAEQLICRLPVTVRRRVRWGECDPAGVVYTPVFSHYAVSAFEWLMDTVLGGRLHRVSDELGFGTPFKALTFEFRGALWPDQVFDMVCTISAIRSRTFDIDLLAIDAQRRDLFFARMTPIFIAVTERRSIPIPDPVRLKLDDYRQRCLSAAAASARA